MKVTLKKVLLLTLFVLVLTALFVVGASAATYVDDNESSDTSAAYASVDTGDGNTYYYTKFEDAFDKANEAGGTVQLLKNVSLDNVAFTADKEIIIDGKKDENNGRYKITATNVPNHLFDANAKFTLRNVDIDCTLTTAGRAILYSDAAIDMAVESCNLVSSHLCIQLNKNNGGLTCLVDNCDLVGLNDSSIYVVYNNSLTINNSYLTAGTGDNDGIIDVNNANATINLKGTTFIDVDATKSAYSEYKEHILSRRSDSSIRMRGGNGTRHSPVITLYDSVRLTKGDVAYINYTSNANRTDKFIQFSDNYTGSPFVSISAVASGGDVIFYDSLADAIAKNWAVIRVAKDVTIDASVVANKKIILESATIVNSTTGAKIADKACTITYTGTESMIVLGNFTSTIKNVNLNAANGTAFTYPDGGNASLTLTNCAITANKVLDGFDEGDSFVTDLAATASAINDAGYSVTEADGKYTVDGRLDFTAIDGAIGFANTAIQNATVTDKPCDVGAGNTYVLAADVETLQAAIATAQAEKEAALNNAALAAATAKLNEAVAAFNAKRTEGKPHEKADTAPACSTTCKYCNVAGTVAATAEHTTAVPCTDTVCTACGETATTIDHERKYDCSNLCKYCDGEHFTGAIGHEREALCSKICKFCQTEQFQDAQAHEQKAPCSNICKFCETERPEFDGTGGHERKSLCSNLCVYCETEQFENAVPCEGAVICTDTTCKYCGGEFTPVAHDGEFVCSTTCKYCLVESIVEDAIPCEGELACDGVCKYCGGEVAHVDHEGEFACSTTCKYGCGTEITDAATCVGEVLCTSTTCKYGCGAEVTPVAHKGAFDCSTKCQWCDEAVQPTVDHTTVEACTDTACSVCGEAVTPLGHQKAEDAPACSTTCKHCGKANKVKVTAKHTVVRPCTDIKCTLCEERVTPVAHQGEYKCSTVCKWCGADVEPVKSHVKKNSCDLVCELCLEETEQVHEYDNDCDTNCNGCNLARETTHKYDNSCDAECNVCGLTREVTHNYKNKRDHTCELCGFDKAPVEEGEDKQEGLELWVIIAIAAGAAVVIAAVVVTIVVLKKKKAKKPDNDPENEEATEEASEEATEENSNEQTEEATEEGSNEKTEEE
jgi:hypothetical protein